MINIPRSLQFFARSQNWMISEKAKDDGEVQYKISFGADLAYVKIFRNGSALVQGKESYLKQILLLWGNKDHSLPMAENCGTTILSQEWREWKEEARHVSEFIAHNGYHDDLNPNSKYIYHRGRMFHDYMLRNRMSKTISYAKLEEFIKSWFDKNCFMNISSYNFFQYLKWSLTQYGQDVNQDVEFEPVATSLADTMCKFCSKKMINTSACYGCPQRRNDNTTCLFNLIDSIYPYTNTADVVAFNKSNLEILIGKRKGEIVWKSIAASTPIEKIMEDCLKDACMPIIPQFQAYDCNHKYRIDFLLNTETEYKIAIECDGLQYHARPAQYVSDRKRDRYLQRNGILMMRFSSVEIYDNAEKCVKEIDEMLWEIKSKALSKICDRTINYFGLD